MRNLVTPLAAASLLMLGAAGIAMSADKPDAKAPLQPQSCRIDDGVKIAAVLQFLHEADRSWTEQGTLASTHASSADVRSFASDVAKARAAADQKLVALAEKRKIELAGDAPCDPIHAAVMSSFAAADARLRGKSGTAFDIGQARNPPPSAVGVVTAR